MDTNKPELKQSSWKGKSRGGVWGYRFFIFLLKTFGVRAAYLFLYLIVPYFIPFAPKATAASWYYFRKVHRYGRCRSVRMLFVTYYRFGQLLIDRTASITGVATKFKYRFSNLDAFLETQHLPKGVLMLGAHVGSWEVGRQFFDKDYNRKLHIVMFDGEYQRIKQLLYDGIWLPYSVIPLGNDPFSPLIKIKQALESKENVCFQGDRFMDGNPTLEVDFLGKSAKFPLGPFRIAVKFKVPVAFYFAVKEDARTYHFKFTIVDSFTSEEDLLGQYVNALESVVKEHPEQWFNFYKFWS